MAVLDPCGYAEQRDRVRDYQIVHESETTRPFSSERDHPDGYPDGCSPCGKATWWESRTLLDGRHQTRCTECGSTVTFK